MCILVSSLKRRELGGREIVCKNKGRGELVYWGKIQGGYGAFLFYPGGPLGRTGSPLMSLRDTFACSSRSGVEIGGSQAQVGSGKPPFGIHKNHSTSAD